MQKRLVKCKKCGKEKKTYNNGFICCKIYQDSETNTILISKNYKKKIKMDGEKNEVQSRRSTFVATKGKRTEPETIIRTRTSATATSNTTNQEKRGEIDARGCNDSEKIRTITN